MIRQWLYIILGCLITAVGLIILRHSQIVSSGTAGLALNLSYLFEIKFHYLFLLLNIPFLIFSFYKMGRGFSVRTIIAISILSAMTSIDTLLSDFSISPLAGAIIGGIILGVGVSILFANEASLGGSTILALYLKKRFQLDPGKINFAFDSMVIITCLSSISLSKGLISLVSIACTAFVISFYKNRSKDKQHSDQASMPAAATAS